ncbi:MAG: DedA family protein [Kiritimatiellia bacterium]
MLETLAAHLDAIAAMAPAWKFLLIFVFMAVESSFIPFPSEVVMIPAGFLAARVLANGTTELGTSSPVLALTFAILLGVAGSLAGAYANYFLSLKLGKPFLERYGRYFFVKPEPLNRACEVFNRYGAATTFVCRLVPVIRQLISIPAGIARMPLGSFTLFTALGAGIWTIVLALVGFAFGRSSAELSYLELITKGKASVMHNLPLVIGGAVVLVFSYWLAGRLVMGRKKV